MCNIFDFNLIKIRSLRMLSMFNVVIKIKIRFFVHTSLTDAGQTGRASGCRPLPLPAGHGLLGGRLQPRRVPGRLVGVPLARLHSAHSVNSSYKYGRVLHLAGPDGGEDGAGGEVGAGRAGVRPVPGKQGVPVSVAAPGLQHKTTAARHSAARWRPLRPAPPGPAGWRRRRWSRSRSAGPVVQQSKVHTA